jgi:cysteine-rich repeat protein
MRLAACAALLALSLPARAAEFHVAPGGSALGDGSPGAPWDLATALAHPPAVAPGDVVWLHHGVYRGPFESRLRGEESAPIVVRQAPGERAVIDGGCSGSPVLVVDGAHTWYWGFEVTNSDPHRVVKERGPWPTLPRGIGVYTRQVPGGAVGTRFINLVVHDTAGGFGVWKEAVNAEVYGSLLYYNGWEAPERGHGHGIYVQSESGTTRVVDNLLFDQFSHGIHAYASASGFLNGLHVEGNVAFNNGRLSAVTGNARNILVGGGVVAENPRILDNATYDPLDGGGENNLGYFAGATGMVASGNYLAGPRALWMNASSVASFSDNTLIGGTYGLEPGDYPDNAYLPVPPPGAHVVVRPNHYEAGRANVAVFNWDLEDTVPVDLSAVLAPGDPYEVRDAQNFFGPPLASGTFDGSPIAFPMTRTLVARPVGLVPVAPTPTGREFAAFVVRRPVVAVSSCGDGVVDAPGETCDDGNILDGDGCSSVCADESLCAPAPVAGCRTVTAPGQSSLTLASRGGPRDTFVWRWQRGAATSRDDFGDPRSGTRYEVCVYDGSDALLQRIVVPAEDACHAAWRETGLVRKLKDTTRLPDGKLDVILKHGDADGRAQIVVQGRGSFLANLTLPAAPPLRLQLRRSGAPTCWGASFASPQQNTSTRFRARGQ